MKIEILHDKNELGRVAAWKGAEAISKTIAEKGIANIIVATGASQFEMLGELVMSKVDWSKVTAFHLDEYVGIPESHPASFRKYLKERFVAKAKGLKKFHYVNGDSPDLAAELRRLGRAIGEVEIDLAFVGIGENGHLAFNDPPANFDAIEPYIVVDLDEKCRLQQLGEGWFKSLEDVPKQAVSMSIRQIMRSKAIICSVPDKRKAEAVRDCFTGPVINMHPSSILRRHQDCFVMLDVGSASMLPPGFKLSSEA